MKGTNQFLLETMVEAGKTRENIYSCKLAVSKIINIQIHLHAFLFVSEYLCSSDNNIQNSRLNDLMNCNRRFNVDILEARKLKFSGYVHLLSKKENVLTSSRLTDSL